MAFRAMLRAARYTALSLAATLAATVPLVALPAAPAGAAPTCDLWSSTAGNDANPGSQAAPFRTVQMLVNSLGAGKTGCLTAGQVFVEDVTMTKPGTAAAPLTVRSDPSGRASLQGRLVIEPTASDVTVAGLDLNGRSTTSNTSSVTVRADRVRLLGNDITTERTRICVNAGYGRVVSDLVVDGNRIHDCGDGVNQEHGVYLEQTRNARVVNNYIYGNIARGIQLYFDADGTTIANNVIDANGVGVHFGGDLLDGTRRLSENNVVRDNIISNSNQPGRFNVDAYYDNVRPVGDLGNLVTGNCIFHADPARNLGAQEGFRSDGTNVFANPLYFNQAGRDYRLQATSPCKNKGPLPGVTTGQASAVAATGAVLNGMLNPHWTTATFRFEYGTTTALGTKTADVNAGGTLDQMVSATVGNLAPATTYYFRLVATNTSGFSIGTVGSFRTAGAAPTCDLWSSTAGNDANPGSQAAPFRTVQMLVNSLGAGKTGCLTAGQVFVEDVTMTKPGTAAAPLTVRSDPSGRASLQGRLVIEPTASDVTVAGLDLNGRSTTSNASSVTVRADRVRLLGNDITTERTRICVNAGYGRVVSDLVVDGNRIHDCGDGVNQEHGVYLEQTRNARVVNNYIYGNIARGIQLYFDADGTTIANNVIDANGVGVHFGGDLLNGTRRLSENNVVRDNIISNSNQPGRFNVDAYYDNVRPVGDLGNLVTGNCIFHADPARNLGAQEGFRSDGTNVFANPLYFNQAGRDYRLQATSPCKNKGPLPGVTTGQASAVAATGAVLNGMLNPHWTTATFRFEYGTTTALGTKTADVNAGGTLDQMVSATVGNLAPATTYYFRLVATNTSGFSIGTVGSFRTAG